MALKGLSPARDPPHGGGSASFKERGADPLDRAPEAVDPVFSREADAPVWCRSAACPHDGAEEQSKRATFEEIRSSSAHSSRRANRGWRFHVVVAVLLLWLVLCCCNPPEHALDERAPGRSGIPGLAHRPGPSPQLVCLELDAGLAGGGEDGLGHRMDWCFPVRALAVRP